MTFPAPERPKMPERLSVGTNYGGAYHGGVEIVIPEEPGILEDAVADVIPQCCDGEDPECSNHRYNVRDLAAELVKRWNAHESMKAALESAKRVILQAPYVVPYRDEVVEEISGALNAARGGKP